jgi:hypothetical protein
MNDTLHQYLAGGKTQPAEPATPHLRPHGRGAHNPVVRKVLGYSRFFAVLPALEPRLSAGAVAVWCWLWTCERKGFARVTVRRLASRFRVGQGTAARWLAELDSAGLMRVVRRGRPNRSASVVRVRCTPAQTRPAVR